jgi:hypothetical protein
VLKVHLATGKTLEDFGQIRRGNSTSGKRPPSTVTTTGNSPAFNAPYTYSWIAWSQWHNTTGNPINSFSTNFTVPPAPSVQTDNQLVYIWNGLSDIGGDNVMQPVLQWGNNNRWGSTYWSINNWYVWNGTSAAVSTAELHIAPGTLLQGVLTLTGQQPDGSYNYTSTFAGHPVSAMNITEGNVYNNYYNNLPIAIPQVPIELVAYEVLEAYHGNSYGVVQSNDYPSSAEVSMTNINIQVNNANPAISWTSSTDPQILFGERSIPINNNNPNGEVDIYFRPPSPVPAATITSVSQRPGGGGIGGIIVYFNLPTSSVYYIPNTAFSYTATVTNNRLRSFVTSNQYGPSPLFVNPPTGSVHGDPMSVQISTTYTTGPGTYTSSGWSNTFNFTY